MPRTRNSGTTVSTLPIGSVVIDNNQRLTRQQTARALATMSVTSKSIDPEPEDIPKPKPTSKAKPKSKPKRKPHQPKDEETVSKKPRATKKSFTFVDSIPVPVTPDNSPFSTPTRDEEILKSPSTSASTSTPKSSKNARSPTSTKSPTSSRHQRLPPKEDWESIYQLVEELRADRTAPVDTDGSEALPQRQFGPQVYRFQVLIALMLSSQTKDGVVGDAMRQLQAHGLTVSNIRNTSFDKLNTLIGKVGFHNTKATNILKVADILHTNYDGDIPMTAEEMIDQLPGVGPKMAFIVENIAWGRQTGIGIDTHMHRMFNQLRWVDSKQPEQTRLQLESWLPQQYWPSVNLLWVGLGQEVQQFPDKLLRKALDSSRPLDALKLLKRLGMDYKKVGTKMGWENELQAVLKD